MTKILIVDDEQPDQKSMARVLEREGFEDIAFAENGKDGIHQAKGLCPDIVIIDVVLPDMDGFEVCVQLKQQDIPAKILMVTGHLDAVDAKKARASGADEIIEKIPGFANVSRTINELLKPKTQ